MNFASRLARESKRDRTLIVAFALAEVLVDLGCDLLQGYLIARPGPPSPARRRSTGAQTRIACEADEEIPAANSMAM